MPNNPALYNQKDIQPLKERYQDVNKNEIKFLGKVSVDIAYNNKTTKLPILITQRNDIAPLLGVNWLIQLPIIINKILLDEPTNFTVTGENVNRYYRFLKVFYGPADIPTFFQEKIDRTWDIKHQYGLTTLLSSHAERRRNTPENYIRYSSSWKRRIQS